MELFSRLSADFLPMLSEILKETFTSQEMPASTDQTIAAPLSVLFAVSGDANGTLTVSFDNPEDTARRFLDITIGDPDGATVAEACQEIGNQLVGRLLGMLAEQGAQVEIDYPGSVMQNHVTAGATIIAAGSGKICGGLRLEGQKMTSNAGGFKQEQKVQAATGDSNQLRVLIVDDSPVMCAFLEKIFLERGYEVVGKAADGVEALELFQQCDPDLVTLDIVMPKLKGTEVLERILQMRPDAAVVMATSVSDARTVMKCLKMGARRYIIKPYDKVAVIGAVEKALGLGGRA